MAKPIQYCKVKKKVKEESEKVGLKLNIKKTKIMASAHQLSVVFATILVLSALYYLHSLNMDSPHPLYTVAL